MINGSRLALASAVLGTISVLLLSVVATLLGFFEAGQYNDPAALRPRLFAQDAMILLVAVPVLAISLRAAKRSSLRGRIVWLGAFAFMMYMWASVAGQLAFNRFFLGYVVLFGLSLFTLVDGVATTDATAIRGALDGKLSTILHGGFLALIALGLALMWLSEIVPRSLPAHRR